MHMGGQPISSPVLMVEDMRSASTEPGTITKASTVLSKVHGSRERGGMGGLPRCLVC